MIVPEFTPRDYERILLAKLHHWYKTEHPCAQGYQQRLTEWKDGKMFVRIECGQCGHIESGVWVPQEKP